MSYLGCREEYWRRQGQRNYIKELKGSIFTETIFKKYINFEHKWEQSEDHYLGANIFKE